MDLHVPEGPIRSIKDFLLHIVIVTIGILIALGLEQLVEMHHRHHLAHQAVEGFTRELTADSQQLHDVMTSNPKVRIQIADWIAALSAANPGEIENYPGLYFDPLSTASWDTAMATQALGELPYEQAHLYADAYSAVRIVDDLRRRSLADWAELRSFGQNGAAMTPDQRRTLIERLRRYETDSVVIDSAAGNALTLIQSALGEKPHA
jgi:hypothetical protein